MPTRQQTLIHRFAGGWATDFGTYVDVIPDQAGFVDIPFFLYADNLFYELDGAPHKIGGTTKLNTTAMASGADVTGIFDYWRYAGGASATQKIVAHVGTVLRDVVGAADIVTGLTANSIPDYTVFTSTSSNDILIYTSDNDAPRKWDQSSDAVLAGSPPNFSFSVVHANRLFAAGVVAAGSTLYWSVSENPEDWTGVGSGAINVGPEDGDIINAIASYRGELFVFKGPHRGSIWRLQGTSSESSDPFRLQLLAEGIGCAAQRLVFQFGNDLGFVSFDGSVHSLRDTAAAAGQYLQSSLSLPINNYLRDRLVFNRLQYATATVDRQRGYVLFDMTQDSGTANNILFLMDYRFDPPRWSRLPFFNDTVCTASILDSSSANRPIIALGGTDGFIRRFNQKTRSVDTDQSYVYSWKTPFLSYGDPFTMKRIGAAALSIVPKGNYSLNFNWKRDNNPLQGEVLSQGGGDVLGPTTSPHQFQLNQSRLGGSVGVDARVDMIEGGEFSRIQFQGANAGLGEDAEVHRLATKIEIGSMSLEN